MKTEKLKSLIGTKFLFNDNLISYENFVELLRISGLCTDYIKTPIKDNLDVHSLYIKPNFEVAYLVKLETADEYYKNSGYGCINYKEVTLEEVLDVLGYKAPDKEKILEKEKKPKKQKYITINNDIIDYVVMKKHICYISYNKNKKILYIQFKNTCIESISISEEKYLEIKEMLES